MIDDLNREAIGMEVDFSLPSERVIRELKQIISWRDKLAVIHRDNGPEYISAVIQAWAQEWGIKLEYIQPGRVHTQSAVGHGCLTFLLPRPLQKGRITISSAN